MKKNLVIYHKNCPDGFGSAWVAWKKFGKKADYFAVSHPSSPPKNLANRNIYMLDFCYKEQEMQLILKQASSLTVIDHHISASSAIKFSTNHILNYNNSGATLAWRYFFPKKKIPKLLSHIEDKDIWKFALNGTAEYMALLETYSFDFKIWDTLIKNFENAKKRKSFYEKGVAIVNFSKQHIASLASNAEWVVFSNRKCLAINTPIFVSEIGHILANRANGIGIIWCKKGNHIKISLRSNGKVDVAKIAEKKGGGGHKSAASFSLETDGSLIKLPWKKTR